MSDKSKDVVVVPGTEIGILPDLVSILVSVSKVKPDERNPRKTLDLDVLKKSFERFGVRSAIVVNRRDKKIEAGHQRFYALKELGATHIPVVWADDSETDAKGYNIADNRSAEVVAEWEQDELSRLMEELNEVDYSAIVGFSQDEIDAILFEPDNPIGGTSTDRDGQGVSSTWGTVKSTDRVSVKIGEIETSIDAGIYGQLETYMNDRYNDYGTPFAELFEGVIIKGVE